MATEQEMDDQATLDAIKKSEDKEVDPTKTNLYKKGHGPNFCSQVMVTDPVFDTKVTKVTGPDLSSQVKDDAKKFKELNINPLPDGGTELPPGAEIVHKSLEDSSRHLKNLETIKKKQSGKPPGLRL